jgi:hypothetical protein
MGTSATAAALTVGQTLTGPLFNKPMRVETVALAGNGSWAVGLVGLQSERFRRVTLTEADLAALTLTSAACSYDGDGDLRRLGIQAYALSIAYEFDPYFGRTEMQGSTMPGMANTLITKALRINKGVRNLLWDYR